MRTTDFTLGLLIIVGLIYTAFKYLQMTARKPKPVYRLVEVQAKDREEWIVQRRDKFKRGHIWSRVASANTKEAAKCLALSCYPVDEIWIRDELADLMVKLHVSRYEYFNNQLVEKVVL